MKKDNPNLLLFPELATPATLPSRQDHLTFKANQMRGRHAWLRLTPAYSVQMVEELVAHCSQDALVLDPFCGTGTTALACAERGIACHTIDINPFLVWLTQAKCAFYPPEEIEAANAALASALAGLDASGHESWTPPIADIHKWWDQGTLDLVAQLFESMTAAALSEPTRNLLRVTFCRAVIELAAVSFGHQSMSFKKPERAPTLFAEPIEERVRTVFRRVSAEVLRSAGEPVQARYAQAVLGDSRQLEQVLPQRAYTTVITSPPYPNRMSYIRELRPYMYWLGYLSSGRQAGELDWQAIGGTWGCATSNLATWEPDPAYALPGAYQFGNIIEQVAQHSKLLGRYLAKYFQDTVQHIRSLKRVLAPGAQVFYVVGNSRFYDVLVPTEQIYRAIFQAEGFQEVRVQTIRKRTSKKELFEYVVSARV